jgi:hypothetical protein
MEFLLRSAATDFRAHQPPVVENFRHVRFGHVKTPTGAKQYQLCGEFLPPQQEGKAEWTPFATIKTSGFEQYLGVQAADWCKSSRFVQDVHEDLSPTLQNRLDSIRLADPPNSNGPRCTVGGRSNHSKLAAGLSATRTLPNGK